MNTVAIVAGLSAISLILLGIAERRMEAKKLRREQARRDAIAIKMRASRHDPMRSVWSRATRYYYIDRDRN